MRQLNSTEVVPVSSLEATTLQRVFPLLSCFSVLILLSVCPHEKFSCYHPYSLAEDQTATSVRGKRNCIFFRKQHQHHVKLWSPLLKKHMVQDHLSSSLQLPLCSLHISLFMLSGFLIHILKSSSITAFWFTKCLWRPGRCFTKVRSRTCDLCFRPKPYKDNTSRKAEQWWILK